MSLNEALDLANKIFDEATAGYPDIIDKKVVDYCADDVAKIFDMLAAITHKTAEVLRTDKSLDTLLAVNLCGIMLGTIKNNCEINITSFSKLKQYLTMLKTEMN